MKFLDTSVPLMWTKRGNVPIAELRYAPRWERNGRTLMLHREWFDASGELVSNSIDGYVLPPTMWQRLVALFKSTAAEAKSIALSGSEMKAGGSL